MRFTIATFALTLVLASAAAGPVAKVTEKKTLVETAKLQKDTPKIEDIGDQKDRSKKSTTTFCVEIRPGANEAVQTPCASKDKEAPVPQSASHQASHQASQQAPQQAPQQAAQSAAQAAAASAPPSVNIIHAPPQQPQTLNIFQPAPTLHAVHFVQPHSGPSAVQNLHILQPVAHLPEPVPQTHQFPSSSKPGEENRPSEPSKEDNIVKPSEPAPQPAPQPVPQPEHAEQSHKSEVHVSVVTEDKKKEEESKPQSEKIVEPTQQPAETIKFVQVSPIRQPCEEQLVVVPNAMVPNTMMMVPQSQPCQHSGALIQVPHMNPGTLFQPHGSIYQFPSPIYQQAGPVFTECSCKQTHPASSNLRSTIMPSHVKAEGRSTKIMPMAVVPYPVQNGKSAVSVHCNPESSSVSSSPHSRDSPMIVNMQTVRSKDGMEQGEESDMVQSNLLGERTVSHVSVDSQGSPYYGHMSHAPKIYYDMVPSMQANLYREPHMKPMYGNHHLHVDIGRDAEPTINDSKLEETKEMKMDSPASVARITRSEKDTTTKVEEKPTVEKKVEEKTSSAKIA